MLHSTIFSNTHHAGSNAFKRHILVAIDLSDQSQHALEYALHEVYRPGDCIQLVHVDKVMQPQITIQHNFPGSTYTVPDLKHVDEVQHGNQVVEVIKARFCSLLDEKHVPWVLHLHLDTDNTPPSAVAATLFKVAAEVQPAMIVMAAHNKAYGWTERLLGSVADHCVQNSTWPVVLVRDYRPSARPVMIPAASAQASAAIPTSQPLHAEGRQHAVHGTPVAAAAPAGPALRLPVHSPVTAQAPGPHATQHH